MKIGIIVAMDKEQELLLPLLEDATTSQKGNFTFHSGRVGKHEVTVMRCGIGKVNAAMGALTLVNEFAPDHIINSGVAGGAATDVHVLDVVAGARVAYHDVWCGPECELGQVQGLPLYYEGDADLLTALPQRDIIKRGLICSGDQFVDDLQQLQRIQASFPEVLAVDMESGAIAQVCKVCNVPFLSLRVISDSPGASRDNTRQYLDFWSDAPRESFEILRDMLNNL